jgi:hypothetical protein
LKRDPTMRVEPEKNKGLHQLETFVPKQGNQLGIGVRRDGKSCLDKTEVSWSCQQ